MMWFWIAFGISCLAWAIWEHYWARKALAIAVEYKRRLEEQVAETDTAHIELLASKELTTKALTLNDKILATNAALLAEIEASQREGTHDDGPIQ